MSLSPPSASTFDASIHPPLRLPISINAHILRPAAFTCVEPSKEPLSIDSSASCANQNAAHTLTSIESVPLPACIEIKQEPLQQQQAALYNIAIKQEPTKARTTIKRQFHLPFSLKLRPRRNGRVIKE